jgi:hypothetical protein
MSVPEKVLLLENLLQLDPVECCRFCGCSEFKPCAIAVTEDCDRTMRLARSAEETIDLLPCAWYIDRVCNAPRCIEKLIVEWGGEIGRPVQLFDASGRLLMNAEYRALDAAADDRDFNMIGIALGLKLNEVSREAILERIRELREIGRKRRSA